MIKNCNIIFKINWCWCCRTSEMYFLNKLIKEKNRLLIVGNAQQWNSTFLKLSLITVECATGKGTTILLKSVYNKNENFNEQK